MSDSEAQDHASNKAETELTQEADLAQPSAGDEAVAAALNDNSAVVETADAGQRAFTLKSILFGVLGLLFTIAYTVYNDIFLSQTSFVAIHMPPGPIFLVVGMALIWNPMWNRRWFLLAVAGLLSVLVGSYNCIILDHSFWLSWHWLLVFAAGICVIPAVYKALAPRLILSGRELIVALIIIFVGCWTPGAGLNYFFSTTQVGMWTVYSNSIHMHKYETIHYIPDHLWPAGGLEKIGDNQLEKQRVYSAFQTGYEEQGTDGVPWDAWMPSLIGSWIPLFVLFSICLIAMSLVVHRQWAHHEQLAYPIAEIGTTLFHREKNRILPAIFYDKKFLLAAAFVVAFHGVRYIHSWWPNHSPDIGITSYFNFILDLFPVIKKSGVYSVNRFGFYFTIIGICYFLSREIGLTIGLAPFLLAGFGAQVYLSTGTKIGHDDMGSMRAGAYIAYAAIILYTGRKYYWTILSKALTFKPATVYEQDGVFAARLMIASFIGVIIVLTTSFELELPIAIIFSLVGLLFFLVFTRIICETGIPYLQAAWHPSFLIVKTLGVSTVGAAPLVMLYYLSSMLFVDPKEAMMPYVANSLKMADKNKFNLKKLCTGVMVVVAVAILVSICTRLYQQYTMGGYALSYPWADHNVPNSILKNSTLELTKLEDIGQRTAPGEANSLGFFERISLLNPDSKAMSYLGIGAFGVCLFFFFRFRFASFPLHPVLFLIWGITPNARTFYSFLIGWFIREAIVRFGGGKVYQDLKPFFIGLIFAELFMGIFAAGIGSIYNLFTNERPPGFYVNHLG